MKRISLVAAFAVSLLSLSAESVTIEHTTESGIEAELNAAIEASGTLTSMADITELTIIGEANLTKADFTVLRDNMKTTLTLLDITGATLDGNKLPGGQWDATGSFVNGMTELVEVRLPEDLKGLGGPSFNGCSNLEKVNLNDNITVIPNKCFSGCSKLVLEALPARLTVIEAEAFRTCSSLTIGGPLPETITSIRNNAFNGASVCFTKLPDKLTNLEQNAFQKTNVTFSEIPAGIKTLKQSVFAGTKVTFTTLPEQITAVETYAFQSVKTMPEFTIPDQANLWTKIPDGFFFVAADDVERTFICRAPSAPAATVNVGASAWTGSFSQVSDNHNTTFKVLASAMESFGNTAPYNTMNLVALTTPVMEPVIEMPEGVSADYVKVSFIVNGVEHTDFTGEVLEGEGQFKVDFTEEANSKLYVQEIRFVTPAANDEGDGDGSADEEEPADPDLLYEATGESKDLFKKSVEVAVNVAPGMNAIRVKIAEGNPVSGTGAVEATANTVTRQGNIFYLTFPGAEVYDIAGRMLASSVTNTIDISRLPAGAYILRAGKSAVKILK